MERTGPTLRKNGTGPVNVMKYGGTSVGKFLSVIGGEIIPQVPRPFSAPSPIQANPTASRSYLDAGNRVVVVCSARSGTSKTAGTTNLLLRAASEAIRPRTDLPNGSSPISTPGTPISSSADRANPLSSQIFQRASSSNNFPTRSRSGTSTPGSISASFSSLRIIEEGNQAFNATVDQIKEDHLVAARAQIRDPEILSELEDDLDYDCERLRSFLMAAQVRSFAFVVGRSAEIVGGGS